MVGTPRSEGSIWQSGYDDVGHLVHSFAAYARDEHLPDAFLRAVLENDLLGAIKNADKRNLLALPQLVRFVYRQLSAACWGSPEKVAAWINAAGEKSE